MFFSHYDGAVTQELISDAGLLVERAEVLQQRWGQLGEGG